MIFWGFVLVGISTLLLKILEQQYTQPKQYPTPPTKEDVAPHVHSPHTPLSDKPAEPPV